MKALGNWENTLLSQQSMDLKTLSHFSHNKSSMKPKAKPRLFILGGLPTSPDLIDSVPGQPDSKERKYFDMLRIQFLLH